LSLIVTIPSNQRLLAVVPHGVQLEMSSRDESPGPDQQKHPFRFGISSLLGLTTASAFVLGIAVWTPSFFNPMLATGIAAIIAVAWRKGWRVLW